MTKHFVLNTTRLAGILLFMCALILPHVKSQAHDPRVVHLQKRLLEKIPDIKHTRPALGRTEERPARALEHAQAIVAASNKYASQWTSFSTTGGWEAVDPHTDLPALIAAITYRESAFQSVIRLDDNSKLRSIPAKVAAGQATQRYDSGVMQVRVPSRPAKRCGVVNRKDISRLMTDLPFAYAVGTCVLTNRLTHYVPKYADQKARQLHWGKRPTRELRYFGVIGPRKDTPEVARLQELIVIERYNWGGLDLYNSKRSAGYARKVLTLYEYFRM